MSIHHGDPLQGLVVFTPAIKIWSGTVKLTREDDLKAVKTQLPPAAMVSDGRKALVKTSALAPFHAVRKRVERLLSKVGFRLPDSLAYGVPEDDALAVLSELEKDEEAFNALIPDFLDLLPTHYKEQAAEFPEWAWMVDSGQLPANEVKNRLRFAVGVHKITAPSEDQESGLNRRYSTVLDAAVPALLEDIAGKAEKLLKGTVGKKLTVTQSQHQSVRRLVERLEAFSFLDPRVGPTSQALLDMLSSIPHTGPLSPGNSAVLKIVVESLADPETILQQYTEESEDSAASAAGEPQQSSTPEAATALVTF